MALALGLELGPGLGLGLLQDMSAGEVTFATFSMPFAFSTLLIRQLTDLLQIENKSANSSSTRARQGENERDGECVSEFGNSFCMLRPERCNKNQARDEFAQSAGNYLHVYTEIETQQTQHIHTHIPVLMSSWRTQ